MVQQGDGTLRSIAIKYEKKTGNNTAFKPIGVPGFRDKSYHLNPTNLQKHMISITLLYFRCHEIKLNWNTSMTQSIQQRSFQFLHM